MRSINYKIIMPTMPNYLDISLSFIELLEQNWPEALKNVVLSVAGDLGDKKTFLIIISKKFA